MCVHACGFMATCGEQFLSSHKLLGSFLSCLLRLEQQRSVIDACTHSQTKPSLQSADDRSWRVTKVGCNPVCLCCLDYWGP